MKYKTARDAIEAQARKADRPLTQADDWLAAMVEVLSEPQPTKPTRKARNRK
jgi:hypothetical protein